MNAGIIKKALSKKAKSVEEDSRGALWCEITPSDVTDVMKSLLDAGVSNLLSITSLDEREFLEIIYHFSFGKNEEKTLNVRTKIPAAHPEIRTITDIYPAASILEREAFEMMGITFKGHPDLRNAFLDENSPKTPLRKK